MFGIGMPEMILICALALVVVGPDKLPELARSIAKGVMELKKAASGLKESISDEISPAIDSVKPELEEASKALHENLEQQVKLPYDEETHENAVEESSSSEEDKSILTTEELIARAQKIKNNDLEDTKDA